MIERHQRLAAILWPDGAPSKVVRCRHCATRNRVDVAAAVFDTPECRCGSCDGPLFLTAQEPLLELSSTAYEHSMDRRSLQALKAVPGFPQLLRWVLANVSERMLMLQAMSGHVRCDAEQFPELLRLQDEAASRLDLPYRPRLFLGESPVMNAWTVGIEEPLIVVHSALLDQMDDTEVTAILAHELGHIHADHVLYQTMARLIVFLGGMRSPLLHLLTLPVQMALFKWSRCAELTCDRAGLLGSRDLEACLTIQLKFAGGFRPGTRSRTRLRLAPFVRQARELEKLETANWLDNTLVAMLNMNRTHPFAAWRVMHLLQWVEAGSYLDILAGDYPRVRREDDGAERSGDPAAAEAIPPDLVEA